MIRMNQRKRVVVDGRNVEVDEVVSPTEIFRAAGKDSQDYSLVTNDGQGKSQLVPAAQRIKVRDGQEFETNLPGAGG